MRCTPFSFLPLALLFLLLLALPVEMVKNSDFKTCNESRFCRLHREFATNSTKTPPKVPRYSLNPATIDFTDSKFVANILDSQTNQELSLSLSFLNHGIVRFRIQETDQNSGRYQGPGNYVLKDGENGLQKIDSKNFKIEVNTSPEGTKTHLISFYQNSLGEQMQLAITESPWTISLLQNNKTTIEVNTRGLFNFEHINKKQEVSSSQEQTSESSESGSTVAQKPSFEEKFKNWVDSVPKGPQSFGIDINFPGSSNLYGIPEHASPLSLKVTRDDKEGYSEPYRLYNLDVFEYLNDSPMALYGSVPFLISHSLENTVGLFWMNPSETWVDVSKTQSPALLNLFNKYVSGSTSGNKMSSHWISESGVLDAFLIPGPTSKDVFLQYSSLVGTTSLPREFSLGYHQCRWNYLDQADVLEVNDKFESNKIPYDVIWLDIEHTDGKRYYTWDNKKFPDPVAMQEKLAKHGRKLVNVVDPHIKVDQDFRVSKEASEKGYFIKRNNGEDYKGWCWPGDSNWIDYFNPEASKWISDQYSFENYNNTTPALFVWNDMNEPAVFNGPEITMEKDIVHFGGIEHRDVHNLYGMLVQKATAEGLINREPVRKRPFVLSRSYFAGTQRYGPVWTGDNTADWEHLKTSVSMVLSNCLAGINFNGADVGGFFGNPNPELLTRWYQLGIWYPFFRAHSHIDTKRREPWLLGEPYMTYIRDAIQTRYRLLPYWYTLFYENTLTGMPIVRPMWVEFPKQSGLFDMYEQFMVGPALMVTPVLSEGEAVTQRIYFRSQESYHDLFSDYQLPGPETHDTMTMLGSQSVFVVGGHIIPTKERPRRSSQLMKHDPYTLTIYTSMHGSSKGSLYIDDGETLDYEKGAFIYREFNYTGATLTSKDGAPSSVDSPAKKKFIESIKHIRVERIVVRGMMNSFKRAIINENGKERSVEVTCTKEKRGVCTIRDPAVLITEDWSIRLSFD
ncbi:hypothetical protein BB560_007018 [Smittium megazygosporum]|uniref:Glucosidase II subunit alpha n=1 Tax=Smittium megazygosporum TaxID=133381 RepID=A0A2T9XZE9_9FUNG|nr:hypothetical protein BB560_007018 [Smittium megazygosporum]